MMDMLIRLHEAGESLIRDLGPRPLFGESFDIAQWLHWSDRLAGLTVPDLLARASSKRSD